MENIDINFTNLNRHHVIAKYLESLRQLKVLAEKKYNIRSFQFENYVLFHYFHQKNQSIVHSSGSDAVLTSDETAGTGDAAVPSASAAAAAAAATNYYNQIAFIKQQLLKQIIDRKRKILYWLFYLTIAFLFVSFKNEASTIVVRNIQTFIYPGMKMWRKMTLPVIKRFPGLTELYDESCLMMNPFFQVDDLNCDPCSNVMNVIDITNIDNIEKTTTEFVPFVFKIKQDPINLVDLYDLYNSNRNIFQRDAYRVQSTNHRVTNLDELFINFNQTQTPSQQQSHNLWRCNRMQPARQMRQLFMRPERLPNTGVSLERYVAIDTPNAPSYKLPDTECSNMYVQQALGARFIILRPTLECRHKCRTVSVRLPQAFVLSYNWWYWKPISAPDPMTDTASISLIGSYC